MRFCINHLEKLQRIWSLKAIFRDWNEKRSSIIKQFCKLFAQVKAKIISKGKNCINEESAQREREIFTLNKKNISIETLFHKFLSIPSTILNAQTWKGQETIPKIPFKIALTRLNLKNSCRKKKTEKWPTNQTVYNHFPFKH